MRAGKVGVLSIWHQHERPRLILFHIVVNRIRGNPDDFDVEARAPAHSLQTPANHVAPKLVSPEKFLVDDGDCWRALGVARQKFASGHEIDAERAEIVRTHVIGRLVDWQNVVRWMRVNWSIIKPRAEKTRRDFGLSFGPGVR